MNGRMLDEATKKPIANAILWDLHDSEKSGYLDWFMAVVHLM
jgi:hypothetical protein